MTQTHLGIFGAAMLFMAGAAAGLLLGGYNGVAQVNSQGTVVVRPCGGERAKSVSYVVGDNGLGAIRAACPHDAHIVEVQ